MSGRMCLSVSPGMLNTGGSVSLAVVAQPAWRHPGTARCFAICRWVAPLRERLEGHANRSALFQVRYILALQIGACMKSRNGEAGGLGCYDPSRRSRLSVRKVGSTIRMVGPTDDVLRGEDGELYAKVIGSSLCRWQRMME
jgi:hypothetical protein